jgi:SH3-like domain-containing protein
VQTLYKVWREFTDAQNAANWVAGAVKAEHKSLLATDSIQKARSDLEQKYS